MATLPRDRRQGGAGALSLCPPRTPEASQEGRALAGHLCQGATCTSVSLSAPERLDVTQVVQSSGPKGRSGSPLLLHVVLSSDF